MFKCAVPNFPFGGKLTIHPVALQRANGVYRDPALRHGDNLPQDWIDFVAAVIERYPSFCQIAHRKHQGRVQFALIHMPHGGTSPTNMIESLATHFRPHFYPKLDPGLIDWFDVIPPGTYDTAPFRDKLTIHPVRLQHANGVYRDPEWDNGDNLPQDWIDFVAGVIERSRKTRAYIEAAPHQLENA